MWSINAPTTSHEAAILIGCPRRMCSPSLNVSPNNSFKTLLAAERTMRWTCFSRPSLLVRTTSQRCLAWNHEVRPLWRHKTLSVASISMFKKDSSGAENGNYMVNYMNSVWAHEKSYSNWFAGRIFEKVEQQPAQTFLADITNITKMPLHPHLPHFLHHAALMIGEPPMTKFHPSQLVSTSHRETSLQNWSKKQSVEIQ